MLFKNYITFIDYILIKWCLTMERNLQKFQSCHFIKRSIDLILISQYSTCSSIVVKWNYRMNLYHPCMSIKQFILCQWTLNMSEAFNWWSTSIRRVCCQKDTITFNYITFMTSKKQCCVDIHSKARFYFMIMNENTFY